MNLRTIRAYFDYYAGNASYLFVHIPKNAGVAIRKSPMLQGKLVASEPRFYRSREYLHQLRAFMQANGEHHGLHHARLVDLADEVKSRLQPVAVIRNPWARVVSRYRFSRFAIANGKAPASYAPETFEAFLEERHVYGKKEFYWHRAIRGWYPQADYVVDEQGAIAAHLLRQEHLSDECMRYFDINAPLAERNVSGMQQRPYQDFYNARTEQAVADWYAKDIELFGFDFNSAAKRNVYFHEEAAIVRAAA